jgi:hypothetical protein
LKRLLASTVATVAFAWAGQAQAAPPTLLSVGHVDRHPEATWSLPTGVTARVVEVAVSPATSTDGYFFFENLKAFDTLEETQTRWLYNFQLDPGTYYVHVGGLDELCFFAGLCPVREFSQIATLVIPLPAPPPPPPPPPEPPGPGPERSPRYQATVRTIHPGGRFTPALSVTAPATGPTVATLSASRSETPRRLPATGAATGSATRVTDRSRAGTGRSAAAPGMPGTCGSCHPGRAT